MLFFDNDSRRSELRSRSLDGKELESAKNLVVEWLQLNMRQREQSDLPPLRSIAFEPI